MIDPPTNVEPSPTTPRRRWKWPAALAALVVAGGLLAFGLVEAQGGNTPAPGSHTGSTDALVAQRVAASGTACRQWLAASGVAGTPSTTWCDEWAGWMAGQVASGHLSGTTTWDDSATMLGACHRWATGAGANAAANPAESCGQMVAWMAQYMGSWHSWQDWDHHMGDWTSPTGSTPPTSSPSTGGGGGGGPSMGGR